MITGKIYRAFGLEKRAKLEGFVKSFEMKILDLELASSNYHNEMKQDEAVMVERKFDHDEIMTCLDWYQREIEKRSFATQVIQETLKNLNQ